MTENKSTITATDFAEALYGVQNWFELGLFLGVDEVELNHLEALHSREGINRCLVELFHVFKRLDIHLTWEKIADMLDKLRYYQIADRIRQSHSLVLTQKVLKRSCSPHAQISHKGQSSSSSVVETEPLPIQESHEPSQPYKPLLIATCKDQQGGILPHHVELNHEHVQQITSVQLELNALEISIIETLKRTGYMDVAKLQMYICTVFEIPELPSSSATMIEVLTRLRKLCSLEEYVQFLEGIVDNFLEQEHWLKAKFRQYKQHCTEVQLNVPLEDMLSEIPPPHRNTVGGNQITQFTKENDSETIRCVDQEHI